MLANSKPVQHALDIKSARYTMSILRWAILGSILCLLETMQDMILDERKRKSKFSPPNMTQFQTRKHCNLPRSNGGLIDERHDHFTSAIVGGITIKCNGQ